MLICHCNGVSDRTIRRVVREGANSVREVGRACGAGTCCQGCTEVIGEIINAEQRRHASAEAAPMIETAGASSS